MADPREQAHRRSRALWPGWLARSPLRLPAVRRLCAGWVISLLGDLFTIIALLWFVLDLTGSGADLGLIVLCFSLPGVLTSPLAGRLLDQFDPRSVMALDNLARALIIAAIPVLYWLGWLQLWMVYTLALLAGLLAPATAVGVRVLMPQLVAARELEQANALLSAAMQFSYLVGPALAGLLVSLFGGPPVLLLDAASFCLMAIMLFTLPPVPREQRAAGEPDAKSQRGGFAILLRQREVGIVTLLSLIFYFAYGPLEPALPVYAKQTLGSNAAGYGLLWSAFGVGALLGLFLVPWCARQPRPAILLALSAVLWGLFLLPFVFLRSLPLVALCFLLAGIAWAPYMTIEASLIQRLVPRELWGRVFGARSALTIAAAPLGAAAGGLLLITLSAPAVIGLSALACIVSGLLSLLFPGVRRIRRSEPEDQTRAASG